MKFAENNRISHRQLYRQMILTFLAPFLICLPGKNGIQGMTGIAGALAAVILLVIYVFVLLRVTSGYSDMVRFFGRFWGRIAGLFFLSMKKDRHLYEQKSRDKNTSQIVSVEYHHIHTWYFHQ